jgi:hypothetical protein
MDYHFLKRGAKSFFDGVSLSIVPQMSRLLYEGLFLQFVARNPLQRPNMMVSKYKVQDSGCSSHDQVSTANELSFSCLTITGFQFANESRNPTVLSKTNLSHRIFHPKALKTEKFLCLYLLPSP